MFSNAKTVLINNKEVLSITTSNNGLLYGKSVVNLTSDKQSIAPNETTDLTATYTKGGNPINNTEISFYIKTES